MTSSPEGDDHLVDPAAIERLREWGGDTLLHRMIELFLELGPGRTRDIRLGLESGALEKVERAAHSLKSSAGNLGAHELRATAHRLEAEAAGGEGPDALQQTSERLFEAYERTVEVLRRLRSEGPSEPNSGET